MANNPPTVPSSPTKVQIIERTSAEAARPARARSTSETSLEHTIKLYGIIPPNSPPRRRESRSSLGGSAGETNTSDGRPSAVPTSPMTAHRASILPSPAFFNPKRVSTFSSPGSSTGVSSPSLQQPSAFAQDPHARLRANGPLITRIGSPSLPSPAPSSSGHGPPAPSSSAMARGGSNMSAGGRSARSGVSAGGMSDEDVEADLRLGGRRASRMRREGSAEGRSFSAAAAEISGGGGAAPLHIQQVSDGSSSINYPPPIPQSSSRTQLRDPLLRNASSSSNTRSHRQMHSRSGSFALLPPSLAPEVPLPPTPNANDDRAPAPSAEVASSVPPTVPITDSQGRRLRNYQRHPIIPSPSPAPRVGTKFLFSGRALTSRDNPLPMIGSTCLAVLVPILFLAFESSWLANEVKGGGAALAIWIYICLIMWSSMAKTALSDPGILPRALDETPERKWVDDLYEDGGGEGEDGRGGWRAEPKWVRIGEGIVPSKWCETCHTYRPPRTSHCRLCDNCVLGTDHHCTFLNTCIGRRNYTPFLSFLSSAVLLSILSIAFSAWHIARRSDDIGRWDVAGSIVVIILAVGLGAPIGGLAGYHVRLLWTNRTTIEMLRAKGDRSLSLNPSTGQPLSNPYKLKKPWANMISLACRPLALESWLDPRGYAVRDARAEEVKGEGSGSEGRVLRS